MKYLEIIPDFLAMYGVFTSQSTSRVRQEMSISKLLFEPYLLHYKSVNLTETKCKISRERPG